MNTKKPRGYMTRLLALDCETTGLFFNTDDPSFDPVTKQYYQPVSFGLIVVDADTLKSIEELYVEIKWDGHSQWNTKAEAIHGLSKSYLEANGIAMCDAVILVGNLILKHWGPDSPISILGHNPQFDLCFLKRLLRTEGLNIKFGGRMIDTNSIGFTVFQTYNSDDLFEIIGLEVRGDHNALEDARSALQVVRTVRKLSDAMLGD